MYFWIIIVVLLAGIYNSYFVHGKRFLPILISIITLIVVVMLVKGHIGPIIHTVLAVLAMIIWGANTIEDKLK